VLCLFRRSTNQLLVTAMALLSDLINLDLSGRTGKIIAEYIWCE
jgi:hypothetical protein